MITESNIRAAVLRMVRHVDPISISAVGGFAICKELERQGLARQDGPVMELTGSGWHFGRSDWPEWMRPTIDALVEQAIGWCTKNRVERVKISDLSEACGYPLELTTPAWRIILHCCMGCFKQAGHPPDGEIVLAMRGFDPAEWAALIDAPAWELLPIGGAT